MESIPVVDIACLLRTPSELEWKSISDQVDHVLSSIGFVYLKNHGVPQEIVNEAFAKSLQFYSLPTEIKAKYGKKLPKIFGYVAPNQEILGVGKYKSEIRESFDISLNVHRGLDGVIELIPECPGFVSSLNKLAEACHPVIQNVHKLLARALQVEDVEFFNKASRSFTDPQVQSFTTFRSLFYPPIASDVEPGSVRCSPHSDYGTLTLLFQDAIGGLEVQRTDGIWVPATPVPGTILVNTGDLLNFWSSGRYPATIHRVLIPEIETKKRMWRQSIAYFVHPDDDIMVSPIGPAGKNGGGSIEVSAYEHTKRRLENSYRY